ncbi:hypothetical protein [Anabaena catenula]|uniref:Uncharacterized protein n=1 Tax=Anabaena catenula FACHB-362 TaxID=2692877 RepID=A0ABR8J1H5_9NOST|nr:hypothetical protein [Anabaena catenula]MBD2692177.1 hypothetical protein [Anabaena catenula FACHB-362]
MAQHAGVVIGFWILDFGFWIDPTDKSGGLYNQGIIGQLSRKALKNCRRAAASRRVLCN